MRIVIYLPEAGLGERALGAGPVLAVAGWTRGLAAAGADVSLVFDPHDGHPEVPATPVPLRHIKTALGRIPLRLGRVLRQGDVVMLHSAWVPHNLFAANAARRRGIPYITTPHGGYNPNILGRRSRVKRAAGWLAERRVLLGARAVHLFFEEEIADVRRLGYRGEVIVAPNGIDLPSDVRWDGGSGGYLLWIGVFDVQRKGLDLLLKALSLIPEAERPRLRMHGHDWRGGRATLDRLSVSLGLKPWVSIDGPVLGPDKWEMLRHASLFVFPSRWEAQGLAMMEAAGIGAPLLTTATTALGPRLAAEGAAIAVEARPDAIAKGILEGLSDGATATGARGARFMRERFSWPAVAREFLAQAERLV